MATYKLDTRVNSIVLTSIDENGSRLYYFLTNDGTFASTPDDELGEWVETMRRSGPPLTAPYVTLTLDANDRVVAIRD